MPPKQPKPIATKAATKKKQAPTASRKTTTKSTKETKSVSRKFQQSTTPRWRDIFDAAAHNDTSAVRYFLEQNANLVRMTDDKERTVALIAAESANLPLLQIILEKDTTLLMYPDEYGNTVLQRAIEKDATDMVKYLVEQHKWDVSKPNKRAFGNTPIHVAAEEGKLEILKYFIEEKKGDPDVRNEHGDPPAFLAAEKPFLDVIKYLVEDCKVNVTTVNNDKCTILFASAKRGDVTVPKYLLDEKKIPLDVNWQDSMGSTILYTATRYTKYEFINYIVKEHHANVNLADELGRTPMHVAAYQNNYPMCKFFVDHGADLEVRDAYNKTPLQEASDRKLIGFLDDMTNVLRRERAERGAQRNRRSVPEESLVMLSRQSWTAQSWSSWRIESDAFRSDLSGSGMLDSFFLIAGTIAKYAMGTISPQSSYAAYSPSEFIRRRMDPFAIDAANASFIFERS